MSIADNVEQLRQLASGDEIPAGLLRQADLSLDNVAARTQDILGSTASASEVMGLVNAAKQQIEAALGAVQQLESTLHNIADRHAQ